MCVCVCVCVRVCVCVCVCDMKAIILSSLSFNVKRIVVGLLKWYDCTDCKHT